MGTADVWKVLVEPIAEGSVAAMGSALPEEAKAVAGPMMGILGKAVGAMLAQQIGSGLGALAAEVLSVSDVGLPLAAPGQAALVPANIATFAAGLDVTEDDVLLYLALREAAHQRLFAHVPWLREHLIGAVAAYARGIEINAEGIQSRIEEQMRGIDPMNPESMQGLLEGGLFDMPKSPAQESALQRLEITLALVEGWVDEVVGQATATRMPAAAKMQEAVRRRRAAGGPAEQTFATLVGLELRPRRLRDASTLWGSLRARQGTEARDGVWMHPDLLPTAADLDDPLGFREDAAAPEQLSEDDFDAALRELLDGPSTNDGDAPGDPTDGPGRVRRPGEPARRRAGRARLLGRAHRGAGVAAPALPHPPEPPTPTGCGAAASPTTSPPAPSWSTRPATQVLLNLHRKARRWFAFGGHCEPGDATLAGAARREAVEESGLADLRFDPRAGPPRRARGRLLRPARRGAPPRRPLRRPGPGDGQHATSDESLDVRWWPVDALPELEPEMHELIAIARRRFA